MNIRCFLQARFSQTLFNTLLSACFKTLGRAFQTLGRALPIFGQAFEALRENQKLSRVFRKLGGLFEKLGRVFKKLGRVFVLQYNPCCTNQPQYSTLIMRANIMKAKVNTNVSNAAFLHP